MLITVLCCSIALLVALVVWSVVVTRSEMQKLSQMLVSWRELTEISKLRHTTAIDALERRLGLAKKPQPDIKPETRH